MIAEAADAANDGAVRAAPLVAGSTMARGKSRALASDASHGHGFAAAHVSSVPGIATAPGPGRS